MPKNKNLWWWPKWHLIGVEDFNIEHCPLVAGETLGHERSKSWFSQL
jgi:hypothetical protein